MEARARELLAEPIYDYVAGGAEDEATLADNIAAWGRIRMRPRVLRDVSHVDLTTKILGSTVETPIAVAPTAQHRMYHAGGEPATATGAAQAGALMAISTRASTTVAECAAAAPEAARWYQVYVLPDRARTEALVKEAVEAGCRALALTGDTPLVGRRLRDVRNAFPFPMAGPSLTLGPDEDPRSVDQDPSVTFDHIAWLRDLSGLPVIVKGIVRGDDAITSLDAGAAAVWVSNHGGRQLDGCVATADALAEVVSAVAGRCEVYVDGGIRRGTHALRALAMGATAVFVGRPVIWGLATGGADGVGTVLRGLTAELGSAMALAGCRSISEITPDLIAS